MELIEYIIHIPAMLIGLCSEFMIACIKDTIIKDLLPIPTIMIAMMIYTIRDDIKIIQRNREDSKLFRVTLYISTYIITKESPELTEYTAILETILAITWIINVVKQFKILNKKEMEIEEILIITINIIVISSINTMLKGQLIAILILYGIACFILLLNIKKEENNIKEKRFQIFIITIVNIMILLLINVMQRNECTTIMVILCIIANLIIILKEKKAGDKID